MFKNYVKIAWRNLMKNKLYSFVNIGGLAAGVSCCLLIGLYIANEFTYDHFHTRANNIVRVTEESTVDKEKVNSGFTPSKCGPELKNAFPQITSFVRMVQSTNRAVAYGDKVFTEQEFLHADSSFFSIFTFPLIKGNAGQVLNGPGKIVITRSIERKYFGNFSGLGRILRVDGERNYLVTGIAQDPPANSQIQFGFVASLSTITTTKNEHWWDNIYQTYFLITPHTNQPVLDAAMSMYMKSRKDLGIAAGDYMIFHLEPLANVHFDAALPGFGLNGNIAYLYILAATAILILCIASVNYTNMAIAQSAGRTAEIGIRKVLGSARWQLFVQFIGESALFNLIAIAIAFVFAYLLLLPFSRLVERPLSPRLLLSLPSLILTMLLFVLTSFSAGAYPAFILSGGRLINMLKSGFSFTAKTGPLKKSLIVFQFAISVFLIICTLIIFQQMSWMQGKDLGYNKDHVLVLPVDRVMRQNFDAIKDAVRVLPNIKSVSCGTEETTFIHWDDALAKSTSGSQQQELRVYAIPTDRNFVQTLGLHIVAGNDFTRADWQSMDSSTPAENRQTSFMLNESAVKALNWTDEQALGKIVYRSGNRGIVKAVIKNFHSAPLQEPIRPLIIFLDSGYSHIYRMFVKVSGNNIPSTLHSLEIMWRERVPHRPFQYHFLDDNFNMLYHNEQQTSKIFTTFASLAILLAMLGLFALAAYTVVQRAKEIGIRKVLGAGVWQIALMLSRDFLQLVVLACLIAFPAAWWTMGRWLGGFAYRVQINFWLFPAAGLAVVAIALGTVSFQAVKAALANPVKSLKTE